MRTVAELEKFLFGNYVTTIRGTYSINNYGVNYSQQVVVFHDLTKVLTMSLSQLRKDEDIVDVKIFNEKATHSEVNLPNLVCLTNKCRMIVCAGSVWVSDLTNIDLNKCRVVGQASTGFFGSPMPAVYGDLILNDKTYFKTVDLTLLKDVFNAIKNNINEYKTKPAKEELTATKELYVSMHTENVAEIRKLYEDGIISREEMIELIKSIGK